MFTDQTGEFAVEECKELINSYPDLFRHMLEYKTELRSKLRYIPQFMHVWKYMQPVYQYLSQKYPQDRLLDMYYDFVDANGEASLSRLNERPEITSEGLWLGNMDRFPEKFADDENYDIIRDVYRFKRLKNSAEVISGGTVTDIFCFNPADLKKKPLQELERCVAVVTWSQKKTSIAYYPANS